ncbi:TonB-dependent receptor [Parasphingorhabdus sp.]|uniref:TonB-dependent receptor n=1 Tax=Parasphingorhabdus sp. TaxID=2709688 RepID=UPI003265A9CF
MRTDPAQAARPRPAQQPRPVPIVVNATKLDYTLRDYSGSAQSVSLQDITLGEAAGGLDQILSQLPVTSSTALGSGQNKIFVRGIADSSFNGPTQSTIGLYLGEQRLTYSASNPDLRLYDMERLELLEGPQGTLYGAGSIGGVIRLAPTAPSLDRSAVTFWVSGTATSGGAPGYDFAAMANLPITENEALRGVFYRGQSGGYIDDSLRNLKNINETEVTGGRLAFRSELSSNWSLNLSGFGQKTEARDGQYINARLPGLSQRNSTAQPFGAEIWGVNATLNGVIGSHQIVSSTGILDHDLNTRFDSSGIPSMLPQQAYDETRKIEMFSHETRLSKNDGGPFSWLIGISALRHQDDYRQLITNTNGDAPPPFANIVYTISEYAVFGEANYAVSDRFSAAVGGRLLYSQGKTRRTFGAANTVEPETESKRLLPTAALSWRVSDDVTSYVRFQQGYRTNGITVERLVNGDPRISRFDPDKVDSVEVGMKGMLNTDIPVNFSLAASYMKWRDVQADLIDPNGFTLTRNIGDADIFGLTMQNVAQLTSDLNLSSSFFLNQSRVMRSTPRNSAFSTMLPNIAPYGARLALRYRHNIGDNSELIALASLEYTGESVLDIDALRQVRQGNFASSDISLTWRKPLWEIGLEANNITDTRGNRFSFGNPFQIRQEDQQVPLRPFNVRLSAKIQL